MATVEDLDPALGTLGAALTAAVSAALDGTDATGSPVDFERPRNPDHGDWATSVALRSSKVAGRPPRDIAASVIEHLDLPDFVESIEIAGPGFLNIRLGPAYFTSLLHRIVHEGEAYGRGRAAVSERINVEFVSSNPTGPLHAGHGRWAAAGDCLSALLEAEGHEVVREYYVNDAGEQVRVLGESVLLAALGQPRGEDHYQGDYIVELAEQLRETHGDELFSEGDEDRAPAIAELALPLMLDHMRATLHGMGVDFDVWFSERSLHASGAIEKAIADLDAAGHVYESDGAQFLRTTTFGDDKDRVLMRSDGRPTYFAADCAYLRDKLQRGFDRLIYILGADHHGYVGRLEAAIRCLGADDGVLEVRIGQNVNLLRGGEPVRMSTRAGRFVTLDEVVEEVGVDVARYVYVRQSLDSAMDFDFDRVVEQSMDNPVYYVQYAHARIASLVRTADERGFEHGPIRDVDASRLVHPAETELLRAISQLPLVVADAAELRATQRLARYAEELAATFHRFYTECRVLVDDVELARTRYWLAVAAMQVLSNALALLRVSAPERM